MVNDLERDSFSESQDLPSSLLDSKTSQMNDLLLEKLERVFHTRTSQLLIHNLVKIAIEHDPIDLAHAVTRLPLSIRPIVFDHLLDIDAQVTFIIHVSSSTRAAIFRHISDEKITSIVERMAPDEAVSALEELPDRRLRRVIAMLDLERARRIRELFQHSRFTAGRLMTNEFFAFEMSTSIGEVSVAIRDNPGIELTRSIFVLNEDQELLGYVPERTLIVNDSNVPLRHVMKPVLHSVHPDASRDEVVEIVDRYQIAALPVVDDHDKLLGVITYEDAVEMMEDIADETIANIAGTAERISEDKSIFFRFIARAPWLLVTLCAGIVTSTGMSHFHERTWFLIVPFFIPLIAGMSGNVGIQCSTILVRGIALGELSKGTRRDTAIRELSIGQLIGLIFGVLCGVFVYVLHTYGIYQIAGLASYAVGLIVGAGVFVACLTASALGALSPLLFARLGIDPAIAAGPIVTAFNDVSSTFMFFLVAKILYRFFL